MKLSNHLKLMPSDVVNGQWSVPARDKASPFWASPCIQPTMHVNSMAKLGSDSRGVQCLDNTVLTSPYTVFAKNARLQNKLPEMLGELAGLCWDVVLLCETRSALGTVRLDSGHLFVGSAPLSPAAGVGILLHERHVSKLKLVKQISLRLMFADVVFSHGTVRFVAAYAPHSGLFPGCFESIL